MTTIKNILVPTDFSETSREAMSYARDIAERFQSHLHVLHVIPSAYLGPGAMDVPNLSPEQLQAQWERNARDSLASVFPDAEQATFSGTRDVRVGHPFVEIVRYAKSEGIDLIVMGTHGRGPVGHMLLGSVAEKVVRKAPCPVLTVRHPDHEFVQP